MTKYKLIEIPELIDYIFEHPDYEVGFTGDTLDDIEIYHEPTEWYGVKIDTSFDGLSLVVGYYGYGITKTWDLNTEDFYISNEKVYAEYLFTHWFNEEHLHIGPICVDADDMKGDAL